MKIELIEHAAEKDKLEKNLENHSRQIFLNLAKLWVFGRGNPEIKGLRIHWRTEVKNGVSDVPLMKMNHKYPRSNFIVANTYDKHLASSSSAKSLIDEAISEEESKGDPIPVKPSETRKGDTDGYEKVCKEYISWLAGELSKKGMVSEAEVYRELDKLGLKEEPNFD